MTDNSRNSSLSEAAHILKKGGVILCPTDTLYALTCSARDEQALERILEIKGRDRESSFVVLVNSERLFNQCTGEVPAVAWDMIDNATSPLSMVLPASNFLPEKLRPKGMVAIRFVKDNYVADLVHRSNTPLVTTSAKLSGEVDPLNLEEVDQRILEKVDYVVPSAFDQSRYKRPSKMVQLKENGEVQILRN